MAKYRVAVIGTVGKSVLIDDTLSSRVAALETQIANVGGVTAHSALTGLQQGDDHPQYTMWAAPETIKALWNFQVIPYIQGETLAEYIEDVVAGGSDPFISDSPSITWTYDDTGNHLQADVVDEYIEDLVGSMLVNTTYIDLDYGDSDGSIKAILDTGAVLDLIGSQFQDSSTIDFTYDSGTKRTSAAVIQSFAYAWTAMHSFQAAGNGTGNASLELRSTRPQLNWYDTDGSAGAKAGGFDFTGGTVTAFFDDDTFAGRSTWLIASRSGASMTSLTLTASTSYILNTGKLRLPGDNQELQIGASDDLRMYHDGTNSVIRNDTGDLQFSMGGTVKARLSQGSNTYFRVQRATQATGEVGINIIGGTGGTDWFVYMPSSNNELRFFEGSADHYSMSSTAFRVREDSVEIQLGASSDLRLYHDGTNSIVRTDTGGLRLQFSTNNRMEVNTTGVGFNGATPIARPDYTITNPTTNRSIDVSAITHAQLAQVVGTMIQDFINYGLYQ